MPEGPEIRRAADQIGEALIGRSCYRVWFGLDRLKPFAAKLSGCRVTTVETHGKAMLTRFDNDLTIYSHNQLYGRWFVQPAGGEPETNRQRRLAIYNADYTAFLYSASEIEVLDRGEIERHPFLSRLGPDPLHPSTDETTILGRLTEPAMLNRQLGGLLTDQGFIAGLGNYLRCEILFCSGLHPRTKIRDCSDQQLINLARQIIRLPRQSRETSGITNQIDDAHRMMADGASFESARFWVFRREGLSCHRCNKPIESASHGGQRCYLCPGCQPINYVPLGN